MSSSVVFDDISIDKMNFIVTVIEYSVIDAKWLFVTVNIIRLGKVYNVGCMHAYAITAAGKRERMRDRGTFWRWVNYKAIQIMVFRIVKKYTRI